MSEPIEDELEEVQDETQEQDTQNLSGDENAAETGAGDETAEGNAPSKKRRIRKEPTILTREPGKSLLPFSRVQKIIKADKVATHWIDVLSRWHFMGRQENPMVARDAVFLISLATEEFIKRLSEASQQVAEREKRATVQHRDVGLLRSIC
jgi:histone H3/H4